LLFLKNSVNSSKSVICSLPFLKHGNVPDLEILGFLDGTNEIGAAHSLDAT
jgi:hypothetical protein